MPPMKTIGMNTAASEMVIDRMVKPISREPFMRGFVGRFASLDMPDDVLQHHDGVIDHKADRQGQGHQREIVEVVAEQATCLRRSR